MIKINLLPVREKVKEENIRYQISVGVLLIAFILVFMGYLQVTISKELKTKKNEVKQSKAMIKKLDRQIGNLKKLEQEEKAIKSKLDIISQLSKNRLGIVKVMDEIAMSKPKKLWLTNLIQKGSLRSFNLELKGSAYDNETVADFMRNLQGYPHFSNVDLTSITKKAKGRKGPTFVQFIITAKVIFPELEKKEKEIKKGKK